MSFNVRLTAFLLLMPAVLNASNILVFMPAPLKSHFTGFQPMFEELANRGHNVTVVSAFPLAKNHRIVNYTDIDVSTKNVPTFNVLDFMKHNFVTGTIFRWLFPNLMAFVLENENLQQLIRSESNSFDLVIIEAFYQECTVALGHKFNAPVINLASTTIWPSISKWLHAPATFSYVPDCCIGVTDHMNFIERVKNTITGVLQTYVEDYVYVPLVESMMNKYFVYDGWKTRPSMQDMLNNVSLTLMNAHRGVGVCRPYLPGIIEVGGMHIKEPKPLPQDLQEYIDSAADGVIFFSFGSQVNISLIPEEKINVFLNVIGKLRQKVIIKWVPSGDIKLPQNLKTGSWLPQNDILAHPNVKLFITHGGLHSIEEALYNAMPVVGIPFFADQITNMRIAERYGYGKMIKYDDLTVKSFENIINDVLTNLSYKENAMIQSNVYRDHPMKPIDQAIYWIEYVIRNGGAKHLKSESIGLNNGQYFLLDVILFLTLLIGIITWLFYRGTVKIASKLKIYLTKR